MSLNICLMCFILFVTINNVILLQKSFWTLKDYPDIRGKPWGPCGNHIPKFGYICDPGPEGVLSRNDAIVLNRILYDLAIKTKCKCQRRAQCVTQTGPEKEKIYVGFVVAVAFVKSIALSSTAQDQVRQTAQKFAEGLQERWALGDCGNSALILVWEEQQLIYIANHGSLTKLYVTDNEAKRIRKKVEHKIWSKNYLGALIEILQEMKDEFNGEPEKPVDVGTLALVFSSTVAIIVVGVIMGCVCAFRCFGNMKARTKNKNSHQEERDNKFKPSKRDYYRRNEIIFNANASNYFDADSERSIV